MICMELICWVDMSISVYFEAVQNWVMFVHCNCYEFCESYKNCCTCLMKSIFGEHRFYLDALKSAESLLYQFHITHIQGRDCHILLEETVTNWEMVTIKESKWFAIWFVYDKQYFSVTSDLYKLQPQAYTTSYWQIGSIVLCFTHELVCYL